jgi:UDP-N-acetylmuramoyl-L-alanyl-D-glutamate--2,6-diaminopimelate ligase
MQLRTRESDTRRSLAELAGSLDSSSVQGAVPKVTVTGLAVDSRQVEPGDLFVATTGQRMDGHAYLRDAAERGAAAAVVQREVEGAAPLPLLRVSDSRRALAEVAAAWHGHPARSLCLVGITGTMGKTSTLRYLEEMLRAGGHREGSVGSLGVRSGGETLLDTGHTVPGPLVLQQCLRDLLDRGCSPVLMEATTHALTQERLRGITFELGVFTGLVPLEHRDYHGSFRHYVESKLRFFRHLRPGAPLVHFADSPVLRGVIDGRDVLPIACGTAPDADVRLRVTAMDAEGTTVRIRAPRGVPRVDGSLARLDVQARLPLLGRACAVNALLAAAAAASLGVEEEVIAEVLGALEPAPRRMQLVQRHPFLILDDYGGHPDTMSAVFEVIGSLRWRRLHLLSGYRADRGVEINRAMAGALGAWLRQVGCETLCLTDAADTADARNRVLPEERAAFQAALRRAGIPFAAEPRLDAALDRVLPGVRAGDLLVILGTQGLDGAAARARRQGAERRMPAGA